jgi:glutamine synthetase
MSFIAKRFKTVYVIRCIVSQVHHNYIVKNVGARHGKAVTFMPKPVFGDNGSGMHVHQRFGATVSRSSTTRMDMPSARS